MITMHHQVFGKSNALPNTFIGGVSSTINTPALLSSKIGLAVNNINNFKVESNEINFTATANYSLQNNVFNANTDIKYYIDSKGKVYATSANTFRDATNVTKIHLLANNLIINGEYTFYNNRSLTECLIPYATGRLRSSCFQNCIILPSIIINYVNSIEVNCFNGCRELVYVSAKACKSMYQFTSTLHGNLFLNCKQGLVVDTNIALATNNSGGPNSNLLYVKNTLNGVVNFYDDNGNYVSTL